MVEIEAIFSNLRGCAANSIETKGLFLKVTADMVDKVASSSVTRRRSR
jgi:hypothetical protein